MRILPRLIAVALLGACASGAPVVPRVAPVAVVASSDTVRVTVPTGTLVGTLDVPAGVAPLPVVLFISGSGPTDRDGNSAVLGGKNDGIRQLAESLSARGIATLRYDKRGVGASRGSGGSESALTVDDFANDAVAWARQLRGDARFGPLVLAGHSEGALLALLAAPQVKADGVVSIAGMGRPMQDVLREQLGSRLPAAMKADAFRVLDSLAAGRAVDSVPPMLMALFRPSVQPYLLSIFRHDPAKLMAALGMPALVAQGTTDLQVTVADAERLAAARAGVRLLRVEGMNHVLKPVSGDLQAQLPSYRTPTPAVSPELVRGVAEFVLGVAASARSGAAR